MFSINTSDARVEHHNRVRHGHHPTGKAHRQRMFQGLRVHQHDASDILPLGLQAWALHEDPTAVHVPGSGATPKRRCLPLPLSPTRGTVISRPPAASVYRDDRSGDDKPGSRVVAAGIGGEHLPGGSAAAQQPVDVPERSRILRRVRRLGARRAAAHLRPAGQLRHTQLVLAGK